MDKDKLIELIKEKIKNAENHIERIRRDEMTTENIHLLHLIRGSIDGYTDILSILERGKI